MAWVEQSFNQGRLSVSLHSNSAVITLKGEETGAETICLDPQTQADAHGWAMMLRRSARRLEEIGKDLN